VLVLNSMRVGPSPSAKPPFPARPAGGRAVTGVGQMGRRPGKKKGGPPQGPPKLEKVGPGRKNHFLPAVLSSCFLPKKAGPPPGAVRATGRCAPRLERAPHLEGTQYRPASPPRRFQPAAAPEGSTYRQQRP